MWKVMGGSMRAINENVCLKNLMWELFEMSQNLSGCGRVDFSVRMELFNNEFEYRIFKVSLIRDLLTIKVRTRLHNTIKGQLVSFEEALKKDKEQYVNGLDLDVINESIKNIVDSIKDKEKVAVSNTYTFSPTTLDKDLEGIPEDVKRSFLPFLFPKFAEYLEYVCGC